MSTRGNICVKVKKKDFPRVNKILSVRNREVTVEKPYIFIYNHFDSYPDCLGEELLSDYPSYEEALELVLQGDCSSPGDSYTERGEDFASNCPRVTGEKFRALQEEYLYVFERNSWSGYDYNESKLDLTCLNK